MPLIYLQDIRLNAVVEGPADAPPLLFCHALGTDLTLWDGVVAACAPNPSIRASRPSFETLKQRKSPATISAGAVSAGNHSVTVVPTPCSLLTPT